MRLPRQRIDQRPFEPGEATLLPHFGGGREYSKDATERMRVRAVEWATARGLSVVESELTVELDGIVARVPFWKMVPGTALVRASASMPLDLAITLEPSSWTHRLRVELGGAALETGDAAFDDRWRVETTDVDLARRLLDHERRQTLLAVPCWCRVTYRNGDVDVLLDAPDLSGDHLLAGVEAAVQLAGARLPASAYRG